MGTVNSHIPQRSGDGVALIFRLHLVLGMTLFLVFPFTRLVHAWSAPVEYFTRKYQVVRARR